MRHCCFVFRFTGRDGADMGVHGADLLSGTGELTEVGSVFVNTYKDLQRCGDVASSFTADSATAKDNGDSESSATIAGETAIGRGRGTSGGLQNVSCSRTQRRQSSPDYCYNTSYAIQLILCMMSGVERCQILR